MCAGVVRARLCVLVLAAYVGRLCAGVVRKVVHNGGSKIQISVKFLAPPQLEKFGAGSPAGGLHGVASEGVRARRLRFMRRGGGSADGAFSGAAACTARVNRRKSVAATGKATIEHINLAAR